MSSVILIVVAIYIILFIHIGIYLGIPLFKYALTYTLRYEVPKIFAAVPVFVFGFLSLVVTAVAAASALIFLGLAYIMLGAIVKLVLWLITKV